MEPDNVQSLHNLCVVFYKKLQLDRAESCLLQAEKLAPDQHYIQAHLSIVQKQLSRTEENDNAIASAANIVSQIAPDASSDTFIKWLYSSTISMSIHMWYIINYFFLQCNWLSQFILYFDCISILSEIKHPSQLRSRSKLIRKCTRIIEWIAYYIYKENLLGTQKRNIK